MITFWIFMALCIGGTLGFILCAVMSMSNEVEHKRRGLAPSLHPMESDSRL